MKLGDTYKTLFSYSQKDVKKFAEVTGDNNPIHLDEEYASKTIFKKPIIHGFLSGCIFSKILGIHFPGEGTIYLKQNMKFILPMFVNKQYEAILEVINIDKEKHRSLIKTTIIDKKSGKTTITGEALVQNPKIC